MNSTMPDRMTMQRAFYKKDSNFEGIFFVGVKTTGIFCRPTCPARKPKKENLIFFSSAPEALKHGFRPCKVCQPLYQPGETPGWLQPLMNDIQNHPDIKLRDGDLRQRSIEPNRIRRWFKKNYGITFQAFVRAMKMSHAFSHIRKGNKVIEAAYDSGYESLSGFTNSFKKTTGFSPILSRKKKIITVTRLTTPLGPIMAAANNKGICLLEFVDSRRLTAELENLKTKLGAEIIPGDSSYFHILKQQLAEYFEGKRTEFRLPLILFGTPFQKKVWRELQKIPYGSTISYKEQARRIGHLAAVRAVARANGENKISIIIPCHRVIGTNGKLVGYGGGLWRKKYLLNLEARNSQHK